MVSVEATEGADVRSVLDRVGSRLQALREARGLTLADVSERTGVSSSTLSRLENGQRRASLEVLLPLAQVYRVPLDELVGAPETGDPRVRLRPRRVNGRTVVPLAHQPGMPQAWKIVVPRGHSVPRLKTHEGTEWLYVLTGRMRLIVGGARPRAESWRGRRVRHAPATLVRQRWGDRSRDPQHLRPPRRTRPRWP